MTTLLDRIIHGVHHMPLSGRLLRLLTVVTGLAVAYYADTLWLLLMASAITVGIAIVSGLELYEAAVYCENTTDEDDDQDNGETGFGRAA